MEQTTTPRSDREILIGLEYHVAGLKNDLEKLGSNLTDGVQKLHDRVVPLEKYKDALVERDIVNKVETLNTLANQFKWSYKTVAVISAGVGFIISTLITYIPVFINYFKHLER